MADITKCMNEVCPLREECYRFTAPDNEVYQSYAIFSFTEENEEVKCDSKLERK